MFKYYIKHIIVLNPFLLFLPYEESNSTDKAMLFVIVLAVDH